ncbi:protein PTST, chloroplastic isoform X3 [Malania oleifera]|uniref:protein PTST, chloroplastic isoform X3 n=1 Tax=Malania oleifera TaxID=397392 RepID=UPI0025AE6A6E|nr:protein PTST, chloroplastic isoform X3 [Malania oleifera]XP_057970661.1 protein PTST, chloroplastic isoform X3 [Malania oleifera]
MECHMVVTARWCVDKQVAWCSWKPRDLNTQRFQCVMATRNIRMALQRLNHWDRPPIGNRYLQYMPLRTFSLLASLEEEFLSSQPKDYSSDDECALEDSHEELLDQPLKSDELKSLLANSERSKLLRKLGEANQQNRFLKRQLYAREDALVNFKSELFVIELEIQALVNLAEEITKTGIPEGSRKINGKYIQSHLLSRLEVVHKKLNDQIKDVGAAQLKEVPLFWCGMAETLHTDFGGEYLSAEFKAFLASKGIIHQRSCPATPQQNGVAERKNRHLLDVSVQVMGSFDGWSQGEHLSPEYTGSYSKFSTTLMLRPGRYEIKFLVDGEWQLSPEFPTTGEGVMENNFLIVE